MISSALQLRDSAWKPLALVSAVSAIISAPVHAQTDDVRSLAPVVVTASRIEQPQTEALPHTTVITREMIRDRQATDVVSLLRAEAGLEITQNGGHGTVTSLFMRGAESRQNLILIDGIPIRDPSELGTAAALQNILPDQIERIEIVRGNVSAIYGSGAIGGVIQIFTKRGEGPASIMLAAEAGSRGTTKLSGALSGQSEGTRYMFSATRFSTDGFSSMNPSQNPNVNPENDRDRNVSVAASVSHQLSRNHELGVRVYANDAKYSYDSNYSSGPTQLDEGKSSQKTISAFSRNRLASNWLSSVTASHTETQREYPSSYMGSSFNYGYKSHTNMLQWSNEIMLSPNWVMTAGVDALRESTSELFGGTFGSNRTMRSAFSGVNGKIDRHSFQANLRFDDAGASGSDTTYYFGYGYALTPAWKLIASASSAFLAPNLYQLYAPWGAGNPGLKAEKSRSRELGAQYSAGVTIVRAVLFDTKTRDQIDFDMGTFQYMNIDQASNRGFELTASSRVADIDVRASLTLQNPTDDTTGQRLSRRAKTLGSLALSKSFGAWRVGGDVQYVGRRPDTAVELPSYVLLNVNARYQVSKAVSLYGRIENLLDREYQTAYGYNQPPRGVFAGVEWRQ